MFNELGKNVMSLGLITEDDVKRLTAIELMLLIIERINGLLNHVEMIDAKLIKLLEDIKATTIEELNKWKQDGSFDALINQSALKKITERIDETNAQLTDVENELKNKATKNSMRKDTTTLPINYREFDTETKQLMTGGSVAVVGVNSVGPENIKEKAVGFIKRTELGTYAYVITEKDEIVLDFYQRKLYLPTDGYAVILYDNVVHHLTDRVIDVRGNGSSATIYYDTQEEIFKVQEVEGTVISERCVLIGTIWYQEWLPNVKLNMNYYIRDEFGNLLHNMTQKIPTYSLFPETKPCMLYSGEPVKIDLINKKLTLSQSGYCTVMVDNILHQVYVGEPGIPYEIPLTVDNFHIHLIYDPTDAKIKAYPVKRVKDELTVNGYNLGVIDMVNPERSHLNFYYTLIRQSNISIQAKQWQGRKIVCLGDSITFGAGGTSWVTYLDELTGCREAKNFGIGGTQIQENDSENGFIQRYQQLDEDADLICVWGGVNDFHWLDGEGYSFGDMSSTSNRTFYGALKNLCDALITRYPNKKIMFITPMKTKGYMAGEHPCYGWNQPNKLGKTLTDYRNAILEVCDFYSIPVLDLYTCGGISPENEAQVQALMPDRIHPNDEGNILIAQKIANFMNNL